MLKKRLCGIFLAIVFLIALYIPVNGDEDYPIRPCPTRQWTNHNTECIIEE